MNPLRELAAKYLYEADLDLNDSTTVKQIIDLMEAYGVEIGRRYYTKGVGDCALGRVSEKLCGNTKPLLE
jgi:hypothetical protein